MMKKAQGMSLKVIIIAVIALIVLVVLILIFTGKVKFFGSQTSDTASKYTGNKCAVPGTNNKCETDPYTCRQQGGVYDESEYDDCGYGCCMM
jgi:hypothetical protein